MISTPTAVSFQERPPGLPGPLWRGVDARVLEDPPDCRGRELVPEAGQLAVDATVAPARIVAGHLQHQRAHRLPSPGPPWRAAREGPAPPDKVRVPAQHGPRRGNQLELAEPGTGQQPGQRGQHRPVGPRQPRCLDLTLEHGDLVAED